MAFEAVKQALETKGYAVSVFETGAEAAAYLNTAIDGRMVGFGGSATLKTLGLYDSLSEHNTVYWHARVKDGMTAVETRTAANAADIYLSSVNGLAETGEIVNIDGTCNRVSSIFYGHQKVYLVVGKNKLAPNFDAALWRARNVAAPKNAQRLGRKTPCAVKGDKCYDCNSPERICCGFTVLARPPMNGSYEVVLINEELGF